MTENFCIAAFDSTHHAIAAEKKLTDAQLSIRIIPVPTQVTAGCGLAVRFACQDFDRISDLLSASTDAAYYKVSRQGREKTVVPL